MNSDMHHDADIAPELVPLNLVDKPDGPGAAMVVSAGLGFFTVGLLTILAEMSEGVGDWLGKWSFADAGVGALAGKTTIGSLVYFASLVLLWGLWRNKNVNIKTAFYVGLGLGLLGALFTFPPFFILFEA